MTNNQIEDYNEGIPIKCKCCRRVVAFYKNGEIYVKCRTCKREVIISHEPESQEFRAIEDKNP